MAENIWKFQICSRIQCFHIAECLCCVRDSGLTRRILFVQGELDVLGQVRAKR